MGLQAVYPFLSDEPISYNNCEASIPVNKLVHLNGKRYFRSVKTRLNLCSFNEFREVAQKVLSSIQTSYFKATGKTNSIAGALLDWRGDRTLELQLQLAALYDAEVFIAVQRVIRDYHEDWRAIARGTNDTTSIIVYPNHFVLGDVVSDDISIVETVASLRRHLIASDHFARGFCWRYRFRLEEITKLRLASMRASGCECCVFALEDASFDESTWCIFILARASVDKEFIIESDDASVGDTFPVSAEGKIGDLWSIDNDAQFVLTQWFIPKRDTSITIIDSLTGQKIYISLPSIEFI